jgi:D-lyxose ketol-isomerase
LLSCYKHKTKLENKTKEGNASLNMTSTRPHKVHQKFKKSSNKVLKKVRKQVEPNHQHTINTQNGKSDGCGCEQLKNNTRDQTTKADNSLIREIQKERENKYN